MARVRLPRLVYDPSGPLTHELVRKPGGFGLGQVPERLKPDATTTAVCGFCSTGCGLEVHLKDGEAVNLSPASDYSVNLGMACPKGWEALAPLDAPDRAKQPWIRDARGKLVPTDWPTALKCFVDRMKGIQAKHGPESIAFLGTGQIPCEELAFLGSLAKFGMGMIHGDGNTRQCMATAVVAYKQSFGFDAPPYTYADFEESDALIFVGANPCIAHPIMWERVCRNRRRPDIVVIDPRRTETAVASTLHIPIKPKSDLTLFYGLARLLFERDWIDHDYIAAHTNGIEGFRAHVQQFTPEVVEATAGVAPELLDRLAWIIHKRERVSFWWTMGVNQSHEGVRVAQSIINLALMTGHIGRPGTGANSITGQCNAMGSRLFSNTTNLLGGHDTTKPDHRKKVATALGIDAERIPSQPSLAYDQILEKVLKGEIKGLWIVATNTLHSWINQSDAKGVLDMLDFLVVQDMYVTTETATQAHLVLPAAGWGEKDGTFINSERRIGLIKKVRHAPGEALADFHIFRLLADAWGCGDLFKEWTAPEAVFQILKRVTEGQPCDITGIEDYGTLEDLRGIQWPLPKGQTVTPRSERRLFEDGRFFHADGRAKFNYSAPTPMAEPTSPNYPLMLLTGRGSSSQWHTQTRTAKSAVLRRLSPQEAYVEINPADARDLKVKPHDWVTVSSQRGSMRARAFVTPTIPPGEVFVPMHYAETNRLTFASFDPFSRQPSYKACAVRIEPEFASARSHG